MYRKEEEEKKKKLEEEKNQRIKYIYETNVEDLMNLDDPKKPLVSQEDKTKLMMVYI